MSEPTQARAPVLEGLRRYHERQTVPFTVPAHKFGRGADPEIVALLGTSAFRNDIPMIVGVDDRRESEGRHECAEQLAAQAWGADQTLFSTNGSSLSAHVAVYAVAAPREKILVTRAAHKSMIAAIIMSQVNPVFLQPEIDPDWEMEHGVPPAHLAEVLRAHPDAKGVFVVSPDYYGFGSDLAALAEACHSRGVPLIVDEAWGPHLPFHPDLPTSAMHAGADLSLGSVHKTMNGLSQGSVIHRKDDRIDPDRLTLCFDLFETTSASSLIIASIDAARRQMALHGEELWSRTLALARRGREELAALPGLRVLGGEKLGTPGSTEMDETKLVLDVRGLGLSGYHAADWLCEQRRLTFELSDHRHLMALFSPGDDDATVDALVAGVRALAEWAERERPGTAVCLPDLHSLKTELVMPPAEAFFRPVRQVPLAEAAGHVAAEMVSPYPPGIPRLVPGERITEPIVEYLRLGMEGGMYVPDASDPKLERLRVVA